MRLGRAAGVRCSELWWVHRTRWVRGRGRVRGRARVRGQARSRARLRRPVPRRLALGLVLQQPLYPLQLAQHGPRLERVLSSRLLYRLQLPPRREDELRRLEQLLPRGGEGEIPAQRGQLLVLLGSEPRQGVGALDQLPRRRDRRLVSLLHVCPRPGDDQLEERAVQRGLVVELLV